eukprot:7694-Prymnesium_polylepis.4
MATAGVGTRAREEPRQARCGWVRDVQAGGGRAGSRGQRSGSAGQRNAGPDVRISWVVGFIGSGVGVINCARVTMPSAP